jgi:hypothetical protein
MLLFLACLIVPGVWGMMIYSIFVNYLPSHWRKGAAVPEEKEEINGLSPEVNGLSPEVWDYQI